MPQLIGAIIVIIVALEVLRWVIQWVWVSVIWLWEVFLMPLFVYFTPAVFMTILVTAVCWGSWIAARNYFLSLSANVQSDDLAGKYTRNYILATLTITLASIYVTFAISFAILIYIPSERFVFHVEGHYNSIEFPSFHIRPLFGS